MGSHEYEQYYGKAIGYARGQLSCSPKVCAQRATDNAPGKSFSHVIFRRKALRRTASQLRQFQIHVCCKYVCFKYVAAVLSSRSRSIVGDVVVGVVVGIVVRVAVVTTYIFVVVVAIVAIVVPFPP